MFPVHGLRPDMSCFGCSLAVFAAPTSTLLKEIYRPSKRDSFPVIKSWERWSKVRQQSCLWEPEWVFPGWAVWTVSAGTAGTEWKIYVTSLPLPDTQWMEATPSMLLCAPILPSRYLMVWMMYTLLLCCA